MALTAQLKSGFGRFDMNPSLNNRQEQKSAQ